MSRVVGKVVAELPKNVAGITLDTVKSLVAKEYVDSKEFQWSPKVIKEDERKFHAHPGMLLQEGTQRWLEQVNLMNPHEHMPITSTFMCRVEAKVAPVSGESFKVKMDITFFRSGQHLCPSAVIFRKETGNLMDGPFPWGGLRYRIDYVNHNPSHPRIATDSY